MLTYFLIIAYIIEIKNIKNIEFKIIVTVIFDNILLYLIFQRYLQISITMLLYIYIYIYIIFINFKLTFIITQDVGDISSESEHITTRDVLGGRRRAIVGTARGRVMS